MFAKKTFHFFFLLFFLLFHHEDLLSFRIKNKAKQKEKKKKKKSFPYFNFYSISKALCGSGRETWEGEGEIEGELLELFFSLSSLFKNESKIELWKWTKTEWEGSEQWHNIQYWQWDIYCLSENGGRKWSFVWNALKDWDLFKDIFLNFFSFLWFLSFYFEIISFLKLLSLILKFCIFWSFILEFWILFWIFELFVLL